jgi:hypothetical protein
VKVLAQAFQKKYRDPQGPGLPRGLIMEVRAILLVGFLILVGFAAWWGSQQLEKTAYHVDTKQEQIPTAAGKESKP